MTAKKNKIWITYSNADKKFVDKFCFDLKRSGYFVNNIRTKNKPGELLIKNIQKEIKDSEIILPIISKHTDTSTWVVNEIGLMISETKLDKNKKLIPIVLDKNIPLPPFINQYVYVDFSNKSNYALNFQKILKCFESSKSHSKEEESNILKNIKSQNNLYNLESDNIDLQNKIIAEKLLTFTLAIIILSLFMLLVLFLVDHSASVFKDYSTLWYIILAFLAGIILSYLIFITSFKKRFPKNK